jgi:ketosteroid isomerase-like protein
VSQNPKQIAETFYSAFSRRDAETMNSCYTEDIHFSDPIFPSLGPAETKALWRMLCTSAKDFSLTYSVRETDADFIRVDWIAGYTFVATGRRVENHVCAQLRVRDGKIFEHKDEFSFPRWSRQALGPIAIVLGYFPFFKKKVQSSAQKNLEKFIASS